MVTCGSRRATAFGMRWRSGRQYSAAPSISRRNARSKSTSHVSPASSAKYRALTEAELDAGFRPMGRFDECTGARWTIRRPSGAGCRGDRLGRAVGTSARRLAGAVLPMVHRRAPEHVPQRARPPRRERSGRSARTDLPPVTGTQATFTYRELRDAVARVAGHSSRRASVAEPRHRLHADGAGGR